MRQSPRAGWTITALLLALAPAIARAQEAAPLEPTGTDQFGFAEKIGRAFKEPVHPVVQTIAAGGALGAGIGYDYPEDSPWALSARAVVTLRRYWLAEVDLSHTGEHTEAAAYARVRDMSRLNFFGPGPDSSEFDQTTFTLRDPVAGLLGAFRLGAISFGGRVEMLWPAVDAGRHPLHPSIEERFGETDAPGLTAQPRFGRYQALINITAPAAAGWGINQGGAYRLTYDVYDDREFERFGFRRFEVEAKHKFAVLRPYHSLTLRGWISSSEPRPGQQVPFFLQHTLGGMSNIRSVDESPLGGDGSSGTLRAFPNHRFRSNHLLLLQSEYRWGVWGPIDATVFFDAGKAVDRRADISLSGLRSDYGFSINLVKAAATMARMDVGFGGEGPRFYFSFGGLLP